MGPKLNLEHLTPDECERIIEVLQKDLTLQHLEQQRIWKINEEVSDNVELCKILAKQNSFNEQSCLNCFMTFRLFFRKKIKCLLCAYNFCSNCCVFNDNHGGYVCKFCVKKKQCERQSMEWFYSKVRSKFKRTGSSKVIRYLCQRNSLPASFSHQENLNMDVSGSFELLTETDEQNLDSLANRLVSMQQEYMNTASIMSDHAKELLNIETSMNNIDSVLSCLDSTNLLNQHKNSDDKMIDLAADQISDITTSALNLIEKTTTHIDHHQHHHQNIDGDDDGYVNIDDDYVDDDDNGGGGGEKRENNGDDDDYDDLSDVINWLDDMKVKHMNCGDDAGEDGDEEEDGDEVKKCDDDNDGGARDNVESIETMQCDTKFENLKNLEKDIYKVYGRTHILEERVNELKDEINDSNDIDDTNINKYGRKVADVVNDVIVTDEKVKGIKEHLNETISN